LVDDKELVDRIRRFQSQSILFIHSDDDAIKRKISAPIKERIKQAAGEKCPLCPNIMISSSIKRTPLDDRESTPDHIVDLVLGGNNTEENFLILCHKCNWAKNHAMQRYLTISGIAGGSPGHKPWRPAFRRKGSYIAKLLEYVEWSFRIEEPSSEHRFPELHGYFMQDRFGKSEEPKSKIEKTPDNISQTPTISELDKRLEKLENTLWKKLIRFIGGLFVRKPKTTRKPKTPPKKDIENVREDPQSASVQYPLIPKFNQAATGLRLPREPEQLSEVITLNEAMDYDMDFKERTRNITEAVSFGKARVMRTIRHIGKLSNPSDPLRGGSKVLKALEEMILANDHWADSERELITQYFSRAQDHMATQYPLTADIQKTDALSSETGPPSEIILDINLDPIKMIEKAKESAAKSSTKKINDHRDRIARTNVDTKETAAEEESMKGANAANIGKTIVMLEDKSGMSSGTTANIVGSNGTQWKLSNGKTIQRSQHMEAWALVATAETNATVEGILKFKHIIKEILVLEPEQRATVSAIGQRFSKEVQASNYDNKKDFFKQNGIDPKITIRKAIAEFFDDEEVTIEDIRGVKWAVLNRRD